MNLDKLNLTRDKLKKILCPDGDSNLRSSGWLADTLTITPYSLSIKRTS